MESSNRLYNILIQTCHENGFVYHKEVSIILADAVGKEVYFVDGVQAKSKFKPIVDRILTGERISKSLTEVEEDDRPCRSSFLRWTRLHCPSVRLGEDGHFCCGHSESSSVLARICKSGLEGVWVEDLWRFGEGPELVELVEQGKVWVTPDETIAFDARRVVHSDRSKLNLNSVRFGQ